MMRLKVDVLYIFDIDSTLHLLYGDVLDYTMTLEAADWWSSPAEKEHATSKLSELYYLIDSLQYDFGDRDDTGAS